MNKLYQYNNFKVSFTETHNFDNYHIKINKALEILSKLPVDCKALSNREIEYLEGIVKIYNTRLKILKVQSDRAILKKNIEYCILIMREARPSKLPFIVTDGMESLHLTRNLAIFDLYILARVSRQAKKIVDLAFHDRACRFGFKGKTEDGAIDYLKSKLKDARFFRCVVGSNMTLNGTLEHLKTISLFGLTHFFKNDRAYKNKGLIEVIESSPAIKEKLDSIASIEAVDAVIMSINKSSIDVLRVLLERGANPNISDSNGSFPIHFAAQLGCLESVKLLVKHGANINVTSLRKNSVIHFACSFNEPRPHTEVIRFFLDNNVDPHVRNIYGKTAAQYVREGLANAANTQSNTLRVWQEALILLESI